MCTYVCIYTWHVFLTIADRGEITSNRTFCMVWTRMALCLTLGILVATEIVTAEAFCWDIFLAVQG